MVSDSNSFLKGLLWFVGVYHIILGLLGIFAKDLAATLAKLFFNFNLTLTDQMYWIINPFAAYLLIFGVFMILAAKDPVKYKNVIYVGIALFAIRVIQRIFFFFTASEGLINSSDPIRFLIAIIIVAAIGTTMFILTRKAK